MLFYQSYKLLKAKYMIISHIKQSRNLRAAPVLLEFVLSFFLSFRFCSFVFFLYGCIVIYFQMCVYVVWIVLYSKLFSDFKLFSQFVQIESGHNVFRFYQYYMIIIRFSYSQLSQKKVVIMLYDSLTSPQPIFKCTKSSTKRKSITLQGHTYVKLFSFKGNRNNFVRMGKLGNTTGHYRSQTLCFK